METVGTLTEPSQTRLEFTYDGLGRRVTKVVYKRNEGAWIESQRAFFIYNGWNLQAELWPAAQASGNTGDGSALIVAKTFLWGSDLSGSLQGAGGVGGLLAITDYTAQGNAATGTAETYAPAYDGNGSIMALTAEDGSTAARYTYGPFGELLRSSGSAATSNPFGFSTKYRDAESGLLYYGYRYLNVALGRWINRDPIEEDGGVNVYGFVGNGSIITQDLLGLQVTAPPNKRHITVTDPKTADDLKQQVEKLYDKSCDCVSTLSIKVHGDVKGIYFDTGRVLVAEASAFGKDLAQSIRFCGECQINISGCNVGLGDFGKHLAAATGCIVKTNCGYGTDSGSVQADISNVPGYSDRKPSGQDGIIQTDHPDGTRTRNTHAQ